MRVLYNKKIGFCGKNRNHYAKNYKFYLPIMIAQKKTVKKSENAAKLSYSERRKLAPMAIPSTFRNGVPMDYRLKFFNYANTFPIVAKRQFLFDCLHQIDAIYRKGITCKRNLTDLQYWYGQLNYDLEVEFSLLD